MTSTELKKKLKQKNESTPESLNVRLHRAISWIKCAEKNDGNLDVQFIALWISFNACYAVEINGLTSKSERLKFKTFIDKLISHDSENRFYNLLWQKFSGPVKMLVENQYVYAPFWEYTRGEINEWENSFRKSCESAHRFLSREKVGDLLEIVLDRLYTLRNQLMHGGATFNSKVNRSQVKDGYNIMKLLVPIIIDIMMQHDTEDWGNINYPIIAV